MIEELVDRAAHILSERMEREYGAISTMLAKYFADLGFVTNTAYEPQSFYLQSVYTDNIYAFEREFNGWWASNAAKTLHIERTDLRTQYYIPGYIVQVCLGEDILAEIFKIDPHTGNNHTPMRLRSYLAPSRFDPLVNVNAMHPMYYVEDTYRQLYSPNEDAESALTKLTELMAQWQAFGGVETDKEKRNQIVRQHRSDYQLELQGGRQRQHQNDRDHFGNRDRFDNRKGDLDAKRAERKAKLYSIMDKWIYRTDYDRVVPIGLIYERDVEQVRSAFLAKQNATVEIQRQFSKSPFDHRITAVVYKCNGETLAKLWTVLDNEIIPIIPDTRHAHIYVLMRLCLNEHISADILKLDDLARGKLVLFYLLQERLESLESKGLLLDITKCDFVGRYYPINMSRNQFRLDRIIARFNRA